MRVLRRVVLVVLISVMALEALGCIVPTKESVSNKLNLEKYSSAVKDYGQLSEEEKEDLVEDFKEKARELKDKFMSAEMDSAEVIEALSNIELIDGAKKLASKAIDFIKIIDDSRKAYSEAVKSEGNNDYITAIKQYIRVSKEDKENYDIAKVKIEELEEKLEVDIPIQVAGTKFDRDIINNQTVNIQLTNKSDKTMEKVNFIVFAYDEKKAPVRVNFGHDTYVECELAATIEPEETSKDDVFWKLYPKGNEVAEVIVVIDKIEFSDGEKWENPALPVSIEKYGGRALE